MRSEVEVQQLGDQIGGPLGHHQGEPAQDSTRERIAASVTLLVGGAGRRRHAVMSRNERLPTRPQKAVLAADDERLAGRFDYLTGDRAELVDLEDAGDLGSQPMEEPKSCLP